MRYSIENIYKLHMREGEYRGSREEGGEAFHQQKRVLCFSLSLLPLSIVLLSICFLPSSSYLSNRVTLSGLGLTSANRQGHAGRLACEASCTHCTVSFLFVLRHHLHISAVSHSVSPDEDGSESVLCAFLCVRPAPVDHLCPSKLRRVHCQEKQHRL